MSDEPVSSSDETPVDPELSDVQASATAAALSGAAPPEGDGEDVSAADVEEVGVQESAELIDADSGGTEPSDSDEESVADISVDQTQDEGFLVEDTEEEESDKPVGPIESSEEEEEEEAKRNWYILKVQVNRETTIRDALQRRVKVAGLEEYFGEIVVPTEDVVEFTKSGKKRTVKRKLYPGYIVVDMAINDDTWFLVRETPGIGDFTGSAGKPTPMLPREVDRIIKQPGEEEEDGPKKMSIPFNTGDRVRVKEGYFQNFEGDIETIDEANGHITVMINIFGRSTPVELEHWQVEAV